MRLAVCLSHPIQYKSPLLKTLHLQKNIQLQVFYYSDTGLNKKKNSYHGTVNAWDIPLLQGYSYEFLPNLINEKYWKISSFQPFFNPKIVNRLISNRFNTVIIHSYQYPSDWLAYLTAKLSNIAVLFYGDMYPRKDYSGLMRLTRRVVHRTMIRGADACLAIGSVARDVFLNQYDIPEERVFLAPYVVDNEFFMEQVRQWKPEKKQLKVGLGIPEDLPVVLCVAGMVPKKRQIDLVEAVAKVRTACRLVLVGDGPMREQVKQFCKETLPDVIFAGFINQSQLPSYYALADVFVLPSLWEEFGMVINEAMCAGLPILASNSVAATKDLVCEGENGYTFPPGDVSALSQRLQELLDDVEKRRRFGQRSLEIISGWNVDRTVAGILQALDYVTAGSRKLD
jgi:glycosyltransferase involved in cell wall biosynthesis